MSGTTGRAWRWQGIAVKQAPMPSTVIKSYRYQPAGRALDIQFVSGRWYRYHEVPAELGEQFGAAFSKGEFFNAHIRDQFAFTRAIHVEG